MNGKSSMNKLVERSSHRLKGTSVICLGEVHPQAPMMKLVFIGGNLNISKLKTLKMY